MPQYYTLEQSKNAYQHLGRTERSKQEAEQTFKQERTQLTLKWFSSSCFFFGIHLMRWMRCTGKAVVIRILKLK